MQDSVSHPAQSRAIPFDAGKLDALMDAAGIDILVATSKHNVQYLLDAERAIFFDYMDAIGISRYLPVLVYPKGAPDKAGYVGHPPGGASSARSPRSGCLTFRPRAAARSMRSCGRSN